VQGVVAVDLRGLQYFVVLAEELNFGRAAERLYLDRSGLSRAVRRLEESLGVELLSRDAGELELTPAGATLLEHARDVLRAFDRIRVVADAAHTGVTGVLTVSTCPLVRYQLISPILKRFALACPEVHVVRREQLSASIVEDVLMGVLDVGVAVYVSDASGLAREPLKDLELHVLVASSHPLAARDRVTLAELRRERLLNAPLGFDDHQSANGESAFDAGELASLYAHETLAYDEDLSGVRNGDGLLLSARTFPGGPPPGVAVLGIDPVSTLRVELISREDEPAPTVARFLELARQTSGELSWMGARV
jgi:DNA-binding transcriptional LysR family regulator